MPNKSIMKNSVPAKGQRKVGPLRASTKSVFRSPSPEIVDSNFPLGPTKLTTSAASPSLPSEQENYDRQKQEIAFRVHEVKQKIDELKSQRITVEEDVKTDRAEACAIVREMHTLLEQVNQERCEELSSIELERDSLCNKLNEVKQEVFGIRQRHNEETNLLKKEISFAEKCITDIVGCVSNALTTTTATSEFTAKATDPSRSGVSSL